MTTFILWGLTASPYQLKMQSLLDFAGFAWERCTVRRFPAMASGLDEYPSVPFYTEDKRQFYYDSTSLAHYLDQHAARNAAPLTPPDPTLAFICQLIDEAFDEFGL